VKDAAKRREFVNASTRLTHTDVRAEIGALAVAEIAAATCTGEAMTARELAATLRALTDDPRWRELVEQMERAAETRATVAEFARALGLERGISGYAWHTGPMAIYAWWRHRGDFRATLEAVLNCGGDTDTVGAIVGALAGADLGEEAIPREWVAGICEWPRDLAWMRTVATGLREVREGATATPPAYCWPAIPLRNLGFLAIVLTHGFGRLLPR